MQSTVKHKAQANWQTHVRRSFVIPLAGILLSAVLAACGATASQPAAPAAAVEPATPTTAAEPSATISNTVATVEGETAPLTSVTKINLNSATEEELLTIPNMGGRMVREFFEYRPYVSIQQFRQEIGKYVDEAQVADYEQYVYVPINPNEADMQTLQQLPGVDEGEAAELMAARPYTDNAAFLTKLAAYISSEELALAETYLETE